MTWVSHSTGLKQACPNGVFVSLTPGDPNLWTGVIFVRKGNFISVTAGKANSGEPMEISTKASRLGHLRGHGGERRVSVYHELRC